MDFAAHEMSVNNPSLEERGSLMVLKPCNEMSGPFEYIQQMKNMESRGKERQTSSNLAPKGLSRAQPSMPISYLKKKKKKNPQNLFFPVCFPFEQLRVFPKGSNFSLIL